MKKGLVTLLVILSLSGSLLFAQAGSNERKVVTRVAPTWPELARRMHLQGVVRLEVVVRPNGTVKSTRVVGGSPVLVEAAKDAVNKWKFEAAAEETTEAVQVSFVPQSP